MSLLSSLNPLTPQMSISKVGLFPFPPLLAIPSVGSTLSAFPISLSWLTNSLGRADFPRANLSKSGDEQIHAWQMSIVRHKKGEAANSIFIPVSLKGAACRKKKELPPFLLQSELSRAAGSVC